jgi:hypothetical protein
MTRGKKKCRFESNEKDSHVGKDKIGKETNDTDSRMLERTYKRVDGND